MYVSGEIQWLDNRGWIVRVPNTAHRIDKTGTRKVKFLCLFSMIENLYAVFLGEKNMQTLLKNSFEFFFIKKVLKKFLPSFEKNGDIHNKEIDFST